MLFYNEKHNLMRVLFWHQNSCGSGIKILEKTAEICHFLEDFDAACFTLFQAVPPQSGAWSCQRRYKMGPATGLKVGQSIQTKSLSLRLGLIGVGEAAVA